MDINQIQSELMGYIREKFEIQDDDTDFSADINLFDYGYIDSFGSVEIYSHLEKSYQVSITEETLLRSPLKTINDMVAFISRESKASQS
jgi:D-alanine--poly(phosphoribitol) ligase subunit 2